MGERMDKHTRAAGIVCQIEIWKWVKHYNEKAAACCGLATMVTNTKGFCNVITSWSLAVARRDTWHHRLSSRPTAPDIWHARYFSGVGDVSARGFDASLSISHSKIGERGSPADLHAITAWPVGELVNLQIGLKSGLKSCSVN